MSLGQQLQFPAGYQEQLGEQLRLYQLQVQNQFTPKFDEPRLPDYQARAERLEREMSDLKALVEKLTRNCDNHRIARINAEKRCTLLENVALCAMRYSKAQSGRYKRELDQAIDELDRVHALKPGL